MASDNINNRPNPSEWLDQFGDYLYSYALSRVGSKDSAEDIVQETLLAAVRTYGNFSGMSTVKTWLTTILRSKIVDHFRSRGQKKEISWEGFSSPYKNQDPFKGHWIENREHDAWKTNAIEEIESSEFMDVMHKCLEKLPENWRPVVSMKLLEDHKSHDVCKELGISPSNLWVIIHRAKVKLRDCLEKNWFLEPDVYE